MRRKETKTKLPTNFWWEKVLLRVGEERRIGAARGREDDIE